MYVEMCDRKGSFVLGAWIVYKITSRYQTYMATPQNAGCFKRAKEDRSPYPNKTNRSHKNLSWINSSWVSK